MTPIRLCNTYSLFDPSAFILHKQQHRHKFCAIKLLKIYYSTFNAQHKPREGWLCSLSHLALQELALSTLTSPYQYPTKPPIDLIISPFDQHSIIRLDSFKSKLANANTYNFIQ